MSLKRVIMYNCLEIEINFFFFSFKAIFVRTLLLFLFHKWLFIMVGLLDDNFVIKCVIGLKRCLKNISPKAN